MSVVIKAENLSKAYQIGEFSTGTITQDIERWWLLMRGKEDPFLKIGESNDHSTKAKNNIVWSLKDINFEIKQGDAVGVIGRNGAGKSTLLKLLSRVTSPTSGSIKVKGRIASLLEVGTGFHPELTGRENVFLNGAILGMRKNEIKKHFDAIVDFSGVERYIDTPVKRYSSGMYVRLAFAVAAYLESEIMIVDEVLAVGDADFQSKCLGKMDDVSRGEGRTVLFVSHNIASIKSFCKSGILLDKGIVQKTGAIEEVTSAYKLQTTTGYRHLKFWDDIGEAPGNSIVRITRVQATSSDGISIEEADVTEGFYLEMHYTVFEKDHILWHSFNVYDEFSTNIFDTHSTTGEYYNRPHPTGNFKIRVKIPGNLLNEGKITIGCAIFNHNKQQIHVWLKEIIDITILDNNDLSRLTARGQTMGKFPGIIRPMLQWETVAI